MRISDWSSDVCSSDLLARAGQYDRRLGSAFGEDLRATRYRDVIKGVARADQQGARLDGERAGVDVVAAHADLAFDDPGDRKSVGEGKIVSVRFGLGGRRIIQNNIKKYNKTRIR